MPEKVQKTAIEYKPVSGTAVVKLYSPDGNIGEFQHIGHTVDDSTVQNLVWGFVDNPSTASTWDGYRMHWSLSSDEKLTVYIEEISSDELVDSCTVGSNADKIDVSAIGFPAIREGAIKK